MARLPSILLCALTAAAACGDDSTADDTLATEQVSGAVVNSAELAKLVQPLDGSDALLGLGEADLIRQKIEDAISSYQDLLVDENCMSVDTDFLTFVELTFDNCNSLLNLVQVDGALRAELEVTLDNVGEPIELAFGLSTEFLSVTTRRRSVVYTDTDFETHVAVDGTSPIEFLGRLTATELDQTISIDAEASWTVAGDCVTLDAGAQVSGNATGDLGTISASVEDLTRCTDQCPRSGQVDVSYGQGTFLTWMYDGSDVVSVFGPRGKQLDVSLACGR